MNITKELLFHEYVVNKKSSIQISKELKVSKSKVLTYMKRYGIKRRTHKEAKAVSTLNGKSSRQYKKMKLSDDLKNFLYDEYVNNKNSCIEIAKKISTTATTISRWLKVAGIQARTRSEAKLVYNKKHGSPDPRRGVVNKETVLCIYCGKEKKVWPFRTKSTVWFTCSKQCKKAYLKENFSGENAFAYIDGRHKETLKVRQSLDYKDLRESIFKRDEYTCNLCKKIGGNLDAHHIIPVSVNIDKALDPFNIITLCRDCHTKKVNRNEKHYEKMFLDIIAKSVNSVNTLTSDVEGNTEPS